MLFILDTTVASLLDPNSDESVRCLENLLRAHRDGKHVLEIQREDATHLLDILSSELGPRELAALREIAATFSTRGTLRDSVRWYLRVVLGNYDRIPQPGEVVIPLHSLSDTATTQRTVLLSENDDDAAFYLCLAQAVLYRLQMKCSVQSDPAGGGGSTTAAALRRYREQGRICIAVVDSDRICEGGATGTTASEVFALPMDAPPPGHRLCTSSREIENLLPFPLIAEAIPTRSDEAAALTRFERQTSVLPGLASYADLKEGTTLGSLTKRAALGTAPWSHLATSHLKCSAAEPCPAPKSCSCLLTPGFGHFLPRVVEVLQKASPQKKAELLELHARPELSVLGETVVAWCLGSRRAFA